MCEGVREYILLNHLRLSGTLSFLTVKGPLSIPKAVQAVQASNGTECQPSEPSPEGVFLQFLDSRQLLDPRRVDVGNRIEGQIYTVSELTTDGKVLQDRVGGCGGGFGVERNGGRFEVFDVLADPHQLTGQAELFLDRIVGSDRALGVVCAVEVPRIETSEVLDCAEKLVTTDCFRV